MMNRLRRRNLYEGREVHRADGVLVPVGFRVLTVGVAWYGAQKSMGSGRRHHDSGKVGTRGKLVE